MSKSELESFVTDIKKFEILSSWCEKIFNQNPENLVNVIDTNMSFWLLGDDIKWENRKLLFNIHGKLFPFTESDPENCQIGFEPDEEIIITHDKLKLPNDQNGDPWIWVMIDVEYEPGVITPLILHEYAEPIQFGKNHSIIIEKISPLIVNKTVDMNIFIPGQALSLSTNS